MRLMGIRKVIKAIKNHKSFLITSHMNLEGDALGSELAFMYLLKKLGKKATVVNDEICPDEYKFLPGAAKIQKARLKVIRRIKFDAFAVLDCSDLGRCKGVAEFIPKDKTVINIDHHISNNNFGDANWVDTRSSCACEMIYRLYKSMGVALDYKKALCLYTGILTDTGSFRHPNTTADTFKIASDLMGYGINANRIYRNVYESVSFSDMRVLVDALRTMSFDKNNGIVWFTLKKDFLKSRKLSFDLTEQILTFGRLIKNARVAVLFKENMDALNQIRVNLRSRDKIDISKVAKVFKGGGHKNASACTVKGSLERVRKRVLKEIIRLLSL